MTASISWLEDAINRTAPWLKSLSNQALYEPIESPDQVWFSGGHTKGVSDSEGTATGLITVREVDRMGDVVEPKGLDLKAYRKNPVVFFNHLPNIIVGTSTSQERNDDNVTATTKFHSLTREADDIAMLVLEGVLRGLSIGFFPREVKELPDEFKSAERAGRHITKSELLEYSHVSVPAVRGALTTAVEKGTVKSPLLNNYFQTLIREHDLDEAPKVWSPGMAERLKGIVEYKSIELPELEKKDQEIVTAQTPAENPWTYLDLPKPEVITLTAEDLKASEDTIHIQDFENPGLISGGSSQIIKPEGISNQPVTHSTFEVVDGTSEIIFTKNETKDLRYDYIRSRLATLNGWRDVDEVNWIGRDTSNMLSLVPEIDELLASLEQKEGRVISSRNLSRLRSCHEALGEVINSAEPVKAKPATGEDEEEEEDDKRKRKPKKPYKSQRGLAGQNLKKLGSIKRQLDQLQRRIQTEN